ncbi:Ankyrin repeats (3 copies) [Stieleria maiorica]|uniref:Ankyrin repeats (3 copies) n=1 Tax=Stieleria maiorica TaxID=2795974 RepID=A0A5B9MJI7_9BACT|nr:ankyrin repeat domain-containing protein [Stieleria maiorica]QEF99814.1 Ankyrin repeats (3 copies) [Stieleria maiorica]
MPIRSILISRVLALPLCVVTLLLASGCGSENADSTDQGPATAEAAAAEAGGESDAAESQSLSSSDPGTDATPETAADALYSPEAFRMAAHDGKLRVVQLCLESGMDINEADANGLTPLAMAAYNGHDDVVTLLIANGATVDSRDRTGKTPLIHAASGPAPTTVEILLDAGAEINAVDNGEHWTALMMAAAEGQAEVVEVLLTRGAKKDMVDIDGESAAYFARQNGHVKIAQRLEQ